MIESEILLQKEKLNLAEYVFAKPENIVFSNEVRNMCEKNTCRMYGTTWACPPAVGTVEWCKVRCNEYENVFIFTTMYHLKDMYDIEEWKNDRIMHKRVSDKVAKIFRSKYPEALVLSAEGCTVCKTCTYPDKPCRFPERMHPATEGYGILVTESAKVCGIKYNNGPETLTYFSMIFY
ncbi:hypothetical protein SDC9_51188 [bioreactor metagenome]|uniref:Metal-binding protein n=1 Tax=bioreactor metagenome TaxID=1076179 RepID=A0A644WMS0_9ZZZZ|nr:DUF2284 domain-containing protein [Dehalobacter sp. DCM]